MLKLNFIRRFFSSTHVSIQCRLFRGDPDVQKLCRIVSGVGSLDDMEVSLNQSLTTLNTITPSFVVQVIDFVGGTEASSRRLLRFFSWARQKSTELGNWDEAFNHAIRMLAGKKDLTAVDILVADLREEQRQMETRTFCCLVEILVKLGREDGAVGLFKNLEKFKCPIDTISVSAIVHALCSKGHAKKAQGVLWHHRHKLSLPVEPCLYRALLHGWCIHGNTKEAFATLEEMKSLGISPSFSSYNAFLRCVCMRNLRFNPSALVPDATVVIMEMRSCGIPPTAVTFNILLSSLGKVRRVKEACRILHSMRETGCSPDWMSYYLVVRVLYLTGRFGKGNRVVDEMIEEKVAPQARFYHGLVALLCGVGEVGHALDMFERMKRSECCNLEGWSRAFGQVYGLLIGKLCRGGEFNMGRCLWDEAIERGVTLQCSSSLLDPSKTEVFNPSNKVGNLRLKEHHKISRQPEQKYMLEANVYPWEHQQLKELREATKTLPWAFMSTCP